MQRIGASSHTHTLGIEFHWKARRDMFVFIKPAVPFVVCGRKHPNEYILWNVYMYLVYCKWQLQNTFGLTTGVQILTIDYNEKDVKSGMKHECDI